MNFIAGLHDNVTDDSGLEILLTPQLRKYDSGLLTIGHEVSSLHLIPPGLEHFTSVGHCPDLCTQVWAKPHWGGGLFVFLTPPPLTGVPLARFHVCPLTP